MDTSNVLDDALWNSLSLVSKPPAVYRNLSEWDRYSEEYRERQRINLAVGRQDMVKWQEELDENRQQIRDAFERDGANEHHLEVMSEFIERIEQRCMDDARSMQRAKKRHGILLKQMKSIDPAGIPFSKQIFAGYMKLYEDEIETRIQSALFFRALRAEYSPETKVTRSFTDPNELGNYLNQVVTE